MKVVINSFFLFFALTLLTFSSQTMHAEAEVEVRHGSVKVYDQAGTLHTISGSELGAKSKPVSKNATMSSRVYVEVASVLSDLKVPEGSYVQFSDSAGQIVELSSEEVLSKEKNLSLVSAGNSGRGWKLSGVRVGASNPAGDKNSLYMRRVKQIKIIDIPTTIAKSKSGSTCRNTKVYTSIPEALKEADKVCIVNLSGYGFKTIPDAVFDFANLKELVLSRNNLDELPAQIAKLSNLEILIVGRNNLKTLPKSIGQLSQLRLLKLGRNKITSISPEIGNLKKLTLMEVDNNFVRTIPEEVGNMTSLEKLELANNKMEALPETLTKLSNLKLIEITGSSISVEERKRWGKLLSGVEFEWE